LDVNVENLVVLKNIANAFKMEKNVEIFVNAGTVIMERCERKR
jgi:hypothetical protein